MKGLFLLLITFHSVSSNWWYTSQFQNSSLSDPRDLCSIFPGLSRRQRQICLRDPAVVMNIAEGVRKGVFECQFQFQYQRWNCTTFPNDFSLFGKALVKGGTRELAFIEAITSAAATYNLARECSRGFPYCSCSLENWSQFQAHRFAQMGNFKWKGCDEDLKYSTNFVRRFVEAQEHSTRDIKALTSRHNNRVGRYILRRNSEKFCKCHGLSGSCSLRTCWQSVANLRSISSEIRQKYDLAIEVAFDPSGKPVPLQRGQRMPRKTDLMYYEKSKNFCIPDPTHGILGTERRRCEINGSGDKSCDILCCGKAYTVVRSHVVEKCKCSFRWCCEVKCESCNVTKYDSFCS